jgi:hypothetical protein
VAVPFLLDLFRIPADTFQLFLATGVINSRFGTLLAAVHTVAVALLGSAAIVGGLRFHPARVLRYLVLTIVLAAATIGGLRLLFNTALKPTFAGEELVYSMRPLMTQQEVRLSKQADLGESVEKPAGSVVDSIKKRGVLRVGVLTDRVPFAFVTRDDNLVGFDVEMAQARWWTLFNGIVNVLLAMLIWRQGRTIRASGLCRWTHVQTIGRECRVSPAV